MSIPAVAWPDFTTIATTGALTSGLSAVNSQADCFAEARQQLTLSFVKVGAHAGIIEVLGVAGDEPGPGWSVFQVRGNAGQHECVLELEIKRFTKIQASLDHFGGQGVKVAASVMLW